MIMQDHIFKQIIIDFSLKEVTTNVSETYSFEFVSIKVVLGCEQSPTEIMTYDLFCK